MGMDDDVIWEILTKLPTKSIVRFKSVSKRWGSLLSTSKFVKDHLQISRKRSCKDDLISLTNELLVVPFRIDPPTTTTNNNNIYAQALLFGLEVMHCDGLLCLYMDTGNFIVWNPLTKQHKLFQGPWQGGRVILLALLGFGYDSIADDYKIVCITWERRSIYTLRLKEAGGPWNKIGRIESIPCPFFVSTHTTLFFNGCNYWLNLKSVSQMFKDDDDKYVILCFDLENERMGQEIDIPSSSSSSPLSEPCSDQSLSVLEGSLCLLKTYQDRVEIWRLQQVEEGGRRRRGKQLLVKQVTLPRVMYDTKALWCSSGGTNQVLVTNAFLKLYLCGSKDFSEEEEIVLRDDLGGGDPFDYVMPFTASLVPPDGNYSILY